VTEEAERTVPRRVFPTEAGVFLGLGLGGFFDGIVLHQVLQWHHMVSLVPHRLNRKPENQYDLGRTLSQRYICLRGDRGFSAVAKGAPASPVLVKQADARGHPARLGYLQLRGRNCGPRTSRVAPRQRACSRRPAPLTLLF
jgi:hypothetical protein